ncbi:MAG: HAMP domain-containing histidine kinase [Anaerolinea sp.]|nr:HAMP domain-containing histidine kinase [Anaerolinea sp.]
MTRGLRVSAVGVVLIAAVIGGVLFMQSSAGQQIFSTEGFEPHGHCFLWIPTLVRLYSVSDLLIGLSYTVISITLTYLVYRASKDIPFHWVFLAFGAFIFTCGVTHFMDVITLWSPAYWFAASAKAVTAIASVSTAVIMPPLVPRVLHLVRSARMSEARQRQLAIANAALDTEIRRRERIEEELREALERERQLSSFRMNVITRLNHEFRTPMASAQAASELLYTHRERMSLDDQNERLMTIQQEILTMSGILDDILTVERLDAGQMPFQPIQTDLSELCRSIINGLRLKTGDSGRVFFKPDIKCREVMVDSRLVTEILSNLLQNALKYSPEGGSVRCEITCTGTSAQIKVTDEGMGISLEDLPNIFETFYRGGNSGNISGTGLGLSIVRRSVELHHGTIDVQSTPERGTTFTVRLPTG